jgi:hypothetical protein
LGGHFGFALLSRFPMVVQVSQNDMGNLVRDQRSERGPRLPGEIKVEIDGKNTASVGLRELPRD